MFGIDTPILHDARGKPYVGADGVHISISHTDGWCLAAVGDCALGADIERIADRPWERLAKRFFSPDEAAYAVTHERFYEIWCAKESYVKYTGEGFSRTFPGFCVLNVPLSFTHFSHDGCHIAICAPERAEKAPSVIDI